MDIKIVQMFKNYCLVFDIVRIVDPRRKKVILSSNEDDAIQKDRSCFGVRNDGNVCINCTSFRAYNEKETFMKTEYLGDGVYWFMSVPIEVEDKLYIFELLKDITEEKFIENNAIKMKKEIDRINLLSVTDELTSTYNRRYINECLPLEIINNTMQNKNLTITIMDIDFFKSINDTYGHLAGDYILKEVVKIIKNDIRTDDWIARYGGEEFLIVFSHNKCENIVKVIDRIRKKIEEYDFIFAGVKIHVTASFGMAELAKGENIDILLEKADKKLYEAKKSGRNKVMI